MGDPGYKQMHDFTAGLSVLLTSEGFNNKYTVPQWYPGMFDIPGSYSSSIDILLRERWVSVSIHPILNTLLRLNSNKYPKDVYALVDELREVRTGCQECHYSDRSWRPLHMNDEGTKFCGRGMVMGVPGCTSFAPCE